MPAGDKRRIFFLFAISGLLLGLTTGYTEILKSNFNVTGNLTVGGVLKITPVWDDERVPITATTRLGSNDPAFTRVRDNGTSQGVFTYAYSKNIEQEVYFAVQLPHAYVNGSNLRPHIHFTTPTNGTGSIVWGLEYTCTRINATFGLTHIITGTAGNSNVAYKHQYMQLPEINGTLLSLSAICNCRVYRDATATADNYDDVAYLLEIDFHYQKNVMGSINELD